jgi:3' terminal RNA ribose 2'-O-methyltransferase Hen1
MITHRYLAHQAGLQHAALARLAEVDDAAADAIDNATDEPQATRTEGSGQPLAALRTAAVLDALRAAGAHSVADLGCGEGRLVESLLADAAFTRVIGTDVSSRALELAARRLARMPERQQARARLFQSSLVYTDGRLAGLDAAVLMEVIEHVDPPRLGALARTVFGSARPATVVVTTPNAEHNVRYAALAPGAFRHRDHRFEWTRPQFRDWAAGVAGTFGYTVRFAAVGADDPDVGPPTQMAIFFFRTGPSGTSL